MIPVGVVPAVLSALCYGVTPACARRSIRLLGFARANVWRLVVALSVIGVLAFTVGRGIGDEAATFALAGAVGFGLGGFAMFRALPLLGAPLASLVVETTATRFKPTRTHSVYDAGGPVDCSTQATADAATGYTGCTAVAARGP